MVWHVQRGAKVKATDNMEAVLTPPTIISLSSALELVRSHFSANTSQDERFILQER